MKTLIRQIFEKASFHGFAYIPRRDIHWMERIFWGTAVAFATYWSISVCFNQWERYTENPTVLSVERIVGTRQFPYMGVTMCSNYFDEEQAEIIINNIWNSRRTDDNFRYYMNFLHVLTTVHYDNLEILKPYENDASFDNIPLLQIIWDIRSTLFSSNTSNNKPNGGKLEYSTSSINSDNPTEEQPQMYNVITEAGMCVTTSFLHEYQNPLGFIREPEKPKHNEICSPFDLCNLMVSPPLNDGDRATAYIHSNRDIVPQDDNKGIRREMSANQITNVDVDIELISAERAVLFVPIENRKCRFPNENNLKYFKIYRPILCRNECRINAALKLCNCKPFFYVVGDGPTCNVKGMLCLAKANWKDTKCAQCVSLCSVMAYTALKATVHNYGATRFEKSLLINLSLPKMGMRRRVVFSDDQLVVAFGGAASLFLGCSFLSFAQVVCYCMQSLGNILKRWYSQFK